MCSSDLDLQCALGMAQLPRLAAWVARRREIAAIYDREFADLAFARPLVAKSDRTHAYHLYVIEIDPAALGYDRNEAFNRLRAAGIGANVHYSPVHLMSFYRERFGARPGDAPVAEQAAQRILSLPVFPLMSDDDIAHVVASVRGLAR